MSGELGITGLHAHRRKQLTALMLQGGKDVQVFKPDLTC
jgi:hypothetical protein